MNEGRGFGNWAMRSLSAQSSALHWNMKQLENIGEVGLQVLNAYSAISERLGVHMHSQNPKSA